VGENFLLVLMNTFNLGDGGEIWSKSKLSVTRGWREYRQPAFEKP